MKQNSYRRYTIRLANSVDEYINASDMVSHISLNIQLMNT